jgi:hypothetical protein
MVNQGWRLSNYEQNSGDVVQQATEIVQENVWFSTNFNNYVNNLSVLPYDHHELIAMVAPRGLIGYENTDFGVSYVSFKNHWFSL